MNRGDLVLIGDAHLDRDDPDVGAFADLIHRLAGRGTGAIVLLGDLFNLWIGRPEFESAHHREVLDAFAAARARGTAVHYVEGNRDYRIADVHAGVDLDRVAGRGLDLTWGGLRVHAVHGDLANAGDRQYRTWRAVSRSAPFWWLFRCVPAGRRAAVADGLERRMRASNRKHKQEFPEDRVRVYGERILAGGRDLVVLGHFHERRRLTSRDPAAPGHVVVLPLWKDGREHLRIAADGTWTFETSAGRVDRGPDPSRTPAVD
jgi:UDP-2,3-diacylglucosamine hydrolase